MRTRIDARWSRPVRLVTIGVVATGAALGCAALWTEAPHPGDLFDSPLPGLTDEQMLAFLEGDENFGRVFTADEGLGPIFVRASCSHCHIADGRGTVDEIVTRFSLGTDLLLSAGGPQLQPIAIPGSLPEALPDGADVSRRLPLPVFGIGLIEAIPEETILENEDPDDEDGDGVSGRVNWVPDQPFVAAREEGDDGPKAGRFGWKANFSSLVDTVVHAYHQDMGLTTDFLPEEDANEQAGGTGLGDFVPDPELTASHVLRTITYVRLLAPPRRGSIDLEVQDGETTFLSIGCAKCHVPSMLTGENPVEALSQVEVPLYSDLLLHDMGTGLADDRPDGGASGREWRTKPLWGTRLVGTFLDGEPVFLHDGRAKTLEEAILAHGGEALSARNAFVALDDDGQDAVIAFLESL